MSNWSVVSTHLKSISRIGSKRIISPNFGTTTQPNWIKLKIENYLKPPPSQGLQAHLLLGKYSWSHPLCFCQPFTWIASATVSLRDLDRMAGRTVKTTLGMVIGLKSISKWSWTSGGFLKWWYHQIIHFNRVFHYKPSILGYHYFWKRPSGESHRNLPAQKRTQKLIAIHNCETHGTVILWYEALNAPKNSSTIALPGTNLPLTDHLPSYFFCGVCTVWRHPHTYTYTYMYTQQYIISYIYRILHKP